MNSGEPTAGTRANIYKEFFNRKWSQFIKTKSDDERLSIEILKKIAKCGCSSKRQRIAMAKEILELREHRD